MIAAHADREECVRVYGSAAFACFIVSMGTLELFDQVDLGNEIQQRRAVSIMQYRLGLGLRMTTVLIDHFV